MLLLFYDLLVVILQNLGVEVRTVGKGSDELLGEELDLFVFQELSVVFQEGVERVQEQTQVQQLFSILDFGDTLDQFVREEPFGHFVDISDVADYFEVVGVLVVNEEEGSHGGDEVLHLEEDGVLRDALG